MSFDVFLQPGGCTGSYGHQHMKVLAGWQAEFTCEYLAHRAFYACMLV